MHAVLVPAFLALSAALWLPYGVFCFVRPDYLGGAAGVSASTATGVIELRAMYGGLQAAIGVLAGLACARPTLRQATLVTLLCVYAGLGLSRLAATLTAGEVSAYTGVALVLELGSATLTAWLLSRPEEVT
jgi:hypothetical protein